MYTASRTTAMRQYRQSSNAIVGEASPHRLITMLYDGALEHLANARDAIARQDVTRRLTNIDAAMAIVDYLRTILDPKAGDIAQRLDALYDYMLRRLLVANAKADAAPIVEVMKLLTTIKSGWEAIEEPIAA